jgi:hypothetical protein
MAAISPAVSGFVIRDQQAYKQAEPLAGDTGQTTPSTSPWVRVPQGCSLQLALSLTARTADTTFLAVVETCHKVDAKGVEVDSARVLGSFAQAPDVPSTVHLSAGPTDRYIRVRATPGAGATCVWSVSGRIIGAAHHGGL